MTDHPVEDHEQPLYAPPYPEPDVPVDHRYRAQVLGLLTAGCLFFFAGVAWLASLLWIAFT